MSVITPVILCGGSGTRLWPLSRSDRPKQFISLMGEHTLLEETLLRAQAIAGAADPICVTAATYGPQVRQSLDRLGLRGRLLMEPQPRGTAAALVAAALVARRADPGAVIISLPADHHVEEGSAFALSISRACRAAEKGWLTILGVKPRHASPALGYIMPGAVVDGLPDVHRVGRFVEKPDADLAESLIVGGALWNAGIVMARADTVIEAMRRHEPTVLGAVERSLPRRDDGFDDVLLSANEFAASTSISFDKAVLERHDALVVTALDAAWRDVGTWAEVAELFPADGDGNRNSGRVQFSASRDTFVFSSHRLIVGMGLKDLVVVDTPDALLIANRDDLGILRETVEAMTAASFPELVAEDDRVTTKRVSLGVGESVLAEADPGEFKYWIVIKGQVVVTIGNEKSAYKANESFHVPHGIARTITNTSSELAKLIIIRMAGTGPS